MITYELAVDYNPGTIRKMLVKSYEELLKSDPEHWEPEKKEWGKFDGELYENPETIGQCVFIMLHEGKPVGFSSFDPRNKPVAVIGHNCILPEFRRKGFGTKQLNDLLARLKDMGFTMAKVTTGEHPFFEPARKMYVKCGFIETGIIKGGPDPKYRVLEYELDLHKSLEI